MRPIPTSLAGRPSLPDQVAATRPAEPLDAALLAAYGTLFVVVLLVGSALVLGEMAAYLLARTDRDERR